MHATPVQSIQKHAVHCSAPIHQLVLLPIDGGSLCWLADLAFESLDHSPEVGRGITLVQSISLSDGISLVSCQAWLAAGLKSVAPLVCMTPPPSPAGLQMTKPISIAP